MSGGNLTVVVNDSTKGETSIPPGTVFHTFGSVAVLAVVAAWPALAQPNPERDAYFGEEHIHTSWSVDAWLMGNRLTGPDDALKYAQGQTIKRPMGYDVKIDTPMDFMGVTDHCEYVGVTKEANTPGSDSDATDRDQPADGDEQPVFDGAGADGAAEAADRPDPEG